MTVALVVAGVWFLFGALAARRAWFGWWAIVVAVAIAGAGFASEPSGPVAAVAMGGAVVAVGLIWQFAGGGGRVRRRREWSYLAAVLIASVAAAASALHYLVRWPPRVGGVLASASVVAAAALLTAVTTVPSSRVKRALAGSVLACGLVLAAVVVVVVGLGHRPDHDERAVLGLAVAGGVFAVVLWRGIAGRLNTLANWVAFGERTDTGDNLRTFGARMTRALPLEELLQQLAELLRVHLRLASAEVWVGSRAEMFLVGAMPHRDAEPLHLTAEEAQVVARARVVGDAWVAMWLPALRSESGTTRLVPLAHAGELVGVVVCRRAADAEALSETEEDTLAHVTRQVGVAIHNSQLDTALQASLEQLRQANADLQSSRSRIVAASDAARRKIERDLHDGAQQHLVAMAVKVGLARQLISDDAETVEKLLAELREDTQATLSELRELAHGIYPPLLRDRGLAEALRAACNRSTLPVALECDSEHRFDPEIEAAIYFCCIEALQNAGKHAGEGANVVVRVTQEDDVVQFEVADDGAGFDPSEERAGVGFVNMNDRLGAIGGGVEVDSRPGAGTRVTGRVPLRPGAGYETV
jgi:signal transduction histidine kinase